MVDPRAPPPEPPTTQPANHNGPMETESVQQPDLESSNTQEYVKDSFPKPITANEPPLRIVGVASNEIKGPSHPVSEEASRSRKGKEKVILHHMSILQKRGISGLEQVSTQVLLPSKEIIDLVQEEQIHSRSRKENPPDYAMDIDKLSGSSHTDDKGVNHSANKDLKDHSPNPSK
ncbi:hypothetical protein RIF29_22493 [Crotalaria pallida]|uniref:Uncharacterized protein n=1 Tax=Crotalaria pallida TaxID=3830 RepID=A0AAN9F9B5_CROPI